MTETLEETDDTGGWVTSIFDIGAVGVCHDMYKAWAAPDVDSEQPQPVLKNWHSEDLVAYCGGEYAKLAYNNMKEINK